MDTAKLLSSVPTGLWIGGEERQGSSKFDVLDPSALEGRPTLIAATAGTPRHSLALEHAVRPLFTYLRAVTVPTAVFAAPEDWAGGGGVDAALAGRIERAAGELVSLLAPRSGAASRPAAASSADPFEDVTPFDQLLNGR